ncbi:uncharacterized protein LOC124540489 [Vanessa cardui]|uniref:uncharacterized protein LOC124540489 n=1 Tax=Vanessa cardui TaxID=171605 RepID=UPI001F134AB5|nr:uncharacterized protein LOC124540489 [Vanessa cardui]
MSLSPNTPLLKTKNKTVEELKLYDVRMKTNLAKHIITACMNKTINRNNISDNDFYIEAHNYITASTLLMSTILAKIDNKDKPKTFSDWFEELSWEKSEELNNDTQFLDIPLRECIINHYLSMQCIPSKVSICDYLKNKGINITLQQIKKILIIKGYKTQRLPRNNATIIVEDPEQRFNIMKYLYKILQFRELELHIVYIGEKINKGTDNSMTLSFVAVSSLMGVISRKNQKTSLATNVTQIMESRDDWVLNNVLQHLCIKSVIILENCTNDTKDQIPMIDSKKSDMINWLQKCDIPHSSEMHSAELFELIKRSIRTLSSEKHKIEEICAAYGHKVLRRPRREQYLNIFETFSNFENINTNNWKNLELNLIEREKKIYREDAAVDEIIDKVLTYAKYGTIPYIYTHKCDEGIDEIKMAEIVKI